MATLDLVRPPSPEELEERHIRRRGSRRIDGGKRHKPSVIVTAKKPSKVAAERYARFLIKQDAEEP